jgi:hypothetical protein
MDKPLIFTTPLSSLDCTWRLEKLVAQKHFYFSSGRLTIHIKIDSVEIKGNSFKLFVLCSPHRFKLPALLYFKLNGELRPTEKETTIQLWLQLHKPFSKAERVILFFWHLCLILALTGGIVGILTSTLMQGILIGLIFVLGGVCYLWILYRTHRLGTTRIANLVYQALRQELFSPNQSQSSNSPDWLSSL